MTITDILTVIWRRKWIIIAVTILASATAVAYLQRVTPNFESSTTVRISPQMTEAVNTGMLTGVAVDIDPSVISTPVVLEAAEKTLNVPEGSLAGTITQTVIESATATTTSFQITATAGDPRTSQKRAAAVAAAYTDYLDSVTASAQKTLTEQLTEISEKAKTYQAQVDKDLTDQLAQTNLTAALAQVNALNTSITALQTAGPPATVTAAASIGESTNPTTFTVAGAAIVSGLLAGLGLALARERLDTRIRRTTEIEQATSAPVLAQLPSDRSATRKLGYLPAEGGESSPLSEGLRSLRTTLQIALPRESGVLVVTSVEPGDGKTFVSANLATSWARTGRRVVLVVGDLRRPSLDAYFPESVGGLGLGGLLSTSHTDEGFPSAADVENALQPTSIDGLRVLPAGHVTDDPADTLASARMSDILRTLSASADIVIVDTPPALALADASMVASLADGTIVLAAMNRTKQHLLAHVFTTLTANGAVVLGTVANKSRQKLPRSYTAYYIADQNSSSRIPENTRQTSALDASQRERVRRDDQGGIRAQRDRVLIVCTANESRSPFAAALLRATTRRNAVDIDSAGTEATGRSASHAAIVQAAAVGLDLSTHTSTQFDPLALNDYDLILPVTREHARMLLAAAPDIAPRLFTVRQFARWVAEHERPEGISLGLWLDQESDQSALDFLGDNPDDDIDDPTGRTTTRWKTLVAHLDETMTAISSGLYPRSTSRLPVPAQRTRRP